MASRDTLLAYHRGPGDFCLAGSFVRQGGSDGQHPLHCRPTNSSALRQPVRSRRGCLLAPDATVRPLASADPTDFVWPASILWAALCPLRRTLWHLLSH